MPFPNTAGRPIGAKQLTTKRSDVRRAIAEVTRATNREVESIDVLKDGTIRINLAPREGSNVPR
jgi:hypothetical protein